MPKLSEVRLYPVLPDIQNTDKFVAYTEDLTRAPRGVFAVQFSTLRQMLSSGTNFVPSKVNIYSSVKSIIQAGSNITIDVNDSGSELTINSTAQGGGVGIAQGNTLPQTPANPSFFKLNQQQTIGVLRYEVGLYYFDGSWRAITGRIVDTTPPVQPTTYDVMSGLSATADGTIISSTTTSFTDGQSKLIASPDNIAQGQYWVFDLPAGTELSDIRDTLIGSVLSSFVKVGQRYSFGPLNADVTFNYTFTLGVS